MPSIHQEEEKKARKDEYDAAEFKSRHRSLGNIRFIGELFKFKVCVCVCTVSQYLCRLLVVYVCTYDEYRESFQDVMYVVITLCKCFLMPTVHTYVYFCLCMHACTHTHYLKYLCYLITASLGGHYPRMYPETAEVYFRW